MTTIEEEKYRLRKKMERLRGAMGEEESRDKSQQACGHVLEHPIFVNQQDYSKLTVCTYMPFRSELDITPLMEWCWQQGVNVLVPRANRLKQSLQLHWIESYVDLETGAWGIRELKESAQAWDEKTPIDVVIIPGLSFDLQGGRLGYGGGYYDRFIRTCQRASWVNPVQIAIAFDMQLVEHVPMESHDLKIDKIITESGIMKE